MGGAGLDGRGILDFHWTSTSTCWFIMSHQLLTGPAPKKKRVAESKTLGYNIGIVGSGNLARAIVEGVLASGK